jgi:uncharacterized protein (DUF1778 family)
MPRPEQIVKRSTEIRFRVTPLEKKVIQITADKTGLTVSDFIRSAAMNKTVRVRFSDEELEAYKTLQEYHKHFSRISNLMKNRDPQLNEEIEKTQKLIFEHLKKFEQ